MISNGIRHGVIKSKIYDKLSSSGILSVVSDSYNGISCTFNTIEASYFTQAAGCFSVHCNGQSIVGGGKDKENKQIKKVFVFDGTEYIEICSLNFGRSWASAIYINNRLIVTGGDGAGNNIEYLDINGSLPVSYTHLTLPTNREG